MKLLSTILLIGFCSSLNAQALEISSNQIQTVEKIFRDYTKNTEGTDSEENKNAMKNALLELQKESKKNDLPVLINVWMYYDPTDFSVRELIEPIFYKNKSAALNAITKRLKNKKKWENKETVPYSELIELRKQLTE